MQKMFEQLKQLGLPKKDFAIFGSGPLIVRNIISPENDLDVICRGDAWNKIKKIGSLQISDDYDLEIITLFGGRLTFGNKWGIAEFDTDELIDNAELIGGLPFVKLSYVIGYKSVRRATKDLLHLESLSRSKHAASLTDDEQRLLSDLRQLFAGTGEIG